MVQNIIPHIMEKVTGLTLIHIALKMQQISWSVETIF